MAEIIALFIVFGIYGLFKAWLDGDFKTAKEALKSENLNTNQNQQLTKKNGIENSYLFVKSKKTQEIIKLTKEEWKEILTQNDQSLYEVLYDFNENDYLKTIKNDENEKLPINNQREKIKESNQNSFNNEVKSNTKFSITKEEAILQLKKQKELLDLEIISQEEYDKKKNELKPIIIN